MIMTQEIPNQVQNGEAKKRKKSSLSIFYSLSKDSTIRCIFVLPSNRLYISLYLSYPAIEFLYIFCK
jgi:hypothetical protein